MKLKTLAAWKRSSRARDSLIVMVLPKDMSTTIWPGPSIMLRPASPKVVPLGFAQVVEVPNVEEGEQKAAVLNHSAAVGLPIAIGWPVTSARSEPLTPRVMSTVLPRTRGVNGRPLV